jgi:hypothetical protein
MVNNEAISWIACALGASCASLLFILGRKLNEGRYARPEDRLVAQPILYGLAGLFAGSGTTAFLQATLPVLDTPTWNAWVLPAMFAQGGLSSLFLLCRARYRQETGVLCVLVFIQFLVASIAASVNAMRLLPQTFSALPIDVFVTAYGLVTCVCYYPAIFLHARLSAFLHLPPHTRQRPGKGILTVCAAVEVLSLTWLVVSQRISVLPAALPLAAGMFTGLVGLTMVVLLLRAFYHAKPSYPVHLPGIRAEERGER